MAGACKIVLRLRDTVESPSAQHGEEGGGGERGEATDLPLIERIVYSSGPATRLAHQANLPSCCSQVFQVLHICHCSPSCQHHSYSCVRPIAPLNYNPDKMQSKSRYTRCECKNMILTRQCGELFEKLLATKVM